MEQDAGSGRLTEETKAMMEEITDGLETTPGLSTKLFKAGTHEQLVKSLTVLAER